MKISDRRRLGLCRNGHSDYVRTVDGFTDWTGKNVVFRNYTHSDGMPAVYCAACHREKEQKRIARVREQRRLANECVGANAWDQTDG